MKNLITLFFILVFKAAIADDHCGDVSNNANGKMIITSSVKKSDTEREYEFKFPIKPNQKIKAIILGEGKKSDQIQVIPENIVATVKSPKNWVGLQVHEEEGFYTKVVWTNIGDSDGEVTGFKLILKDDGTLKTKGTYSDGRKTKVMDFGVARYRIILSDGSCLNGKVKAIK